MCTKGRLAVVQARSWGEAENDPNVATPIPPGEYKFGVFEDLRGPPPYAVAAPLQVQVEKIEL